MWYFAWILGTGLACTFAILSAFWLEFKFIARSREVASEDLI